MVSIADACELVTDGTHYTPKDVGQGVPFLTVKDVTDARLDFTNCSFISEADFLAAKAGNSAPMNGDVLFSKDGTVGKVHVITTDQSFAVLSSLAILRPKRGYVDSGYLGHVLRSPSVLDDALKKKTGSAIRRIVLGDLKRVRLPLPPLPEQRRIAAILDQAETLRTQRRAALAQLDSLTQSLFLDMFGDGGTQRLTIGELREKGVLSLHKDGNHGSQYPRSEEFGLEGVPFLSARCVSDDGEIQNDQIDRLKEEKALSLRIGWIESGDVLLAHNASVGKVALYDGRFSKALIGTSLTAFRSNTAALTPRFLAAALRSNDFQTQLEKNMGQTTRNQVPITAQRELHIPLPPLPLQQTFATRVQAIEALKTQHRAALAETDALFASLQQRAFAGNL